MTTTAILGIPLIDSQQDQPDVTHNTAIVMLQALALGAIRRTNNPPGAPASGDTYIVGAVPTGAWIGKANKVATRFDGAWVFIPGVNSSGSNISMGVAQVGLTIFSQEEGGLVSWSGAAWYGTDPALSS